jgi:hypothetical protein
VCDRTIVFTPQEKTHRVLLLARHTHKSVITVQRTIRREFNKDHSHENAVRLLLRSKHYYYYYYYYYLLQLGFHPVAVILTLVSATTRIENKLGSVDPLAAVLDTV